MTLAQFLTAPSKTAADELTRVKIGLQRAIADLDMVLTHLSNEQITHEQAISSLSHQIQVHEVAIETGASRAREAQRLKAALEAQLEEA